MPRPCAAENRDQIAIAELEEVDQASFLIAAVDLVDREDRRHTERADARRDRHVGGRQAGPPVEHVDDLVGPTAGREAARVHARREQQTCLRLLLDAAGLSTIS